MTPETETLFYLATLHGRVHRWFWRGDGLPSRERLQVLNETRQRYLTGGGLPTRTHGASETERKQAETRWRNLEAAGVVSICQYRGRRVAVRFTERGEELISCLTGTGCRHVWWPVFSEFCRAVGRTGRRLLPESYVARAEPFRGTAEQQMAITQLHVKLMPFLTAGYVETCPDTRGRYWICLTDSGRAAFMAGRPKEPPEDWQLNETAAEIYDQAFEATAGEIESIEPQRKSHVIIPVGAGQGWGDFLKYLRTVKKPTTKKKGKRKR